MTARVTFDALARAIYEARFADEPRRCVTPYEDLASDAIAIWHRCARTAMALCASGSGDLGGHVWEAGITEDGLPWAVYVYGHHDTAAFASPAYRQRMARELDRMGCEDPFEWLAGKPAEQLWIYDSSEDPAEPDEFGMLFCSSEQPGAIAITGVRFP